MQDAFTPEPSCRVVLPAPFTFGRPETELTLILLVRLRHQCRHARPRRCIAAVHVEIDRLVQRLDLVGLCKVVEEAWTRGLERKLRGLQQVRRVRGSSSPTECNRRR
jgi:hypothetical protein